MTRPHRHKTGSALLVVLWALAAISGFVVLLVSSFDAGMESDSVRNGLFRARLLADSGLAVARSPLVKPGDPLLRQDFGAAGRYETEIQSEGARININSVIAREDRALLEALFARWGLGLREAGSLTAALFDWVDPDDNPRLGGAEARDYARAGLPGPRNAPFKSVDEMGQVLGFETVEEKRPDWRDYFTVWSAGGLDVNEAEEELLMAVAELTPAQAARVVEFRLGDDGKRFTKDDRRFESLDQFRALLGMPPALFALVQGRLSLNDPVARIRSTGIAGRFRARTEVIVEMTDLGRRTVTYLE